MYLSASQAVRGTTAKIEIKWSIVGNVFTHMTSRDVATLMGTELVFSLVICLTEMFMLTPDAFIYCT